MSTVSTVNIVSVHNSQSLRITRGLVGGDFAFQSNLDGFYVAYQKTRKNTPCGLSANPPQLPREMAVRRD